MWTVVSVCTEAGTDILHEPTIIYNKENTEKSRIRKRKEKNDMPKILCLRLANGEEKRAREIWRTFAADSQFDNNDNKSKSPWRAACE